MNNFAPVVTDALHALETAGVGSVFEKTAIGWNVSWVDGGTTIRVQGATIEEALGSHGLSVIHPKKEIPQGIVEVPAAEDAPLDPKKPHRRSKNQDAAIEEAFVAGTLPEEDHRSKPEEVP